MNVVSPGLTLRPSLSVVGRGERGVVEDVCRRG